METEGWEPVYKEKGDLYPDVMPEVKEYSKIFKKNNYKKILDLGCGTGRNTIYLAQQGFSVYALDISKTGIKITKNKAKKLNLNNIEYKISNITDTKYEDNSFDAIICIFVLSHGLLKDNQEAIDEIYRILKPGGMIITELMSTKDITYGKGKKIEENTYLGGMEDDPHMMHHYFTEKEIKNMFSKFTKLETSEKKYFDEIDSFDIKAIK